jgi:hypothetical protein
MKISPGILPKPKGSFSTNRRINPKTIKNTPTKISHFPRSVIPQLIVENYYKIYHDGAIKEVDRRFLKREV